jgi:hypothetical protein
MLVYETVSSPKYFHCSGRGASSRAAHLEVVNIREKAVWEVGHTARDLSIFEPMIVRPVRYRVSLQSVHLQSLVRPFGRHRRPFLPPLDASV